MWQVRQGQAALWKLLLLTRLTADNPEKRSWDVAMFTIYQAMTQKQEKDTEFKVAADKGTDN